MTVLVTGATGLIGRSLMKNLLSDRETIHVLSRNRSRVKELFGHGVKGFVWQPSTEEIPVEAFEGVETIFHLMGEPVGGRWTKAKVDAIVASRVTSGEKIAQAVRKALPVHLGFVIRHL
jgi:NAD dependent epimerase/dehydratase family enzyme